MECLAEFRSRPGKPAKVDASENSKAMVWMCLDGMFLEVPAPFAKQHIESGTLISFMFCNKTKFPDTNAYLPVLEKEVVNREMEEIRQDIKKDILSLQRFRPSELNPRLVEFALRESKRSETGKEMEFDNDEIDG